MVNRGRTQHDVSRELEILREDLQRQIEYMNVRIGIVIAVVAAWLAIALAVIQNRVAPPIQTPVQPPAPNSNRLHKTHDHDAFETPEWAPVERRSNSLCEPNWIHGSFPEPTCYLASTESPAILPQANYMKAMEECRNLDAWLAFSRTDDEMDELNNVWQFSGLRKLGVFAFIGVQKQRGI